MNAFWNVMVPELTVRDYSKSLAFYTVFLGFSIRYQRENPAFAYLTYEERVQIMIEAFHSTGWNTEELVYPFGRGINLQMEVTSIAPIVMRLRAKQYPLYEEPAVAKYVARDQIYSHKEFLVLDPDGYLLRFYEEEKTAN